MRSIRNCDNAYESAKSLKSACEEEVITMPCVNSESSKSADDAKEKSSKGSAKSASKVGCSYLGCDKDSNFCNDVGSMQGKHGKMNGDESGKLDGENKLKICKRQVLKG